MTRLPFIAILFMAGILLNCLRQLINYSPVLTHEVLVTSALACFAGAALTLVADIISYRRARRRGEVKS